MEAIRRLYTFRFFVIANFAGAQPDLDPSIVTGWYSDDGTNWHLVPTVTIARVYAG